MARGGSTTRIVKPLRSGQITIPAEFRERLGITADSVLQMSLTEGELRIRPLEVTRRAAGSPWLKELYDLFAPVREEAKQFSEAEVDAAIDSAVRAVRREHA
ncbi:MAG TPA: AbrB/MazE/SpoVT family DNA-binding domain-containing protein [Chloroflexota bacterium]|jgi:AbrB family looped-hinge helix DNA binding protein